LGRRGEGGKLKAPDFVELRRARKAEVYEKTGNWISTLGDLVSAFAVSTISLESFAAGGQFATP
jgi:hypothetical protein